MSVIPIWRSGENSPADELVKGSYILVFEPKFWMPSINLYVDLPIELPLDKRTTIDALEIKGVGQIDEVKLYVTVHETSPGISIFVLIAAIIALSAFGVISLFNLKEIHKIVKEPIGALLVVGVCALGFFLMWKMF